MYLYCAYARISTKQAYIFLISILESAHIIPSSLDLTCKNFLKLSNSISMIVDIIVCGHFKKEDVYQIICFLFTKNCYVTLD